jgi:hypothetical protein
MKGRRCFAMVLALALLLFLPVGLSSAQGPTPRAPLGTAFTYQGYLTGDDAPINGPCDLQFALWDDPVAGNQVGPLLDRPAVFLTDGRFTVQLDFSNVFDGTALWLEIAVRCGDPGYTTLTPRQALTAAPYALDSRSTEALQGYAVGIGAPVVGQSLKWDGSAWVAAPDENTTYSAGAGLVLSGTVFSADPAYLQLRVTGVCADGFYMRQVNGDGSVLCSPDADTTYAAGVGLVLTGTVFGADTTYLQRRVSQACPNGYSIQQVYGDGTVLCTVGQGGDITAVYVGPGLLGGGAAGAVTLTVNFSGTGSADTVARADHNHDATYAPIVHTHDHGTLSGLLDNDHPQYPLKAGTETVTGGWTFDRSPAAPFLVPAGSAVVVNLDADLLDGQHASSFAPVAHNHWGQAWGGSGTGLTLNSSDGTGLAGTGASTGLYGAAAAVGGHGVYGTGTGNFSYGVIGVATYGVYGEGTSYGVWGRSTSTAVRAEATGGSYGLFATGSTAVYGSATTTGVYGYSTGSYGVYGWGGAYGVYGYCSSGSGYGVYGANVAASGASTGVYGTSASSAGYGVYGGDTASAGTTFGVYGTVASPNGWSGYFTTAAGNGVYISVPAGQAGLNVASGTKNAVVRTADGSRLLYTEESTEVWFTDYGTGQLQDGRAIVRIDPRFAETVNLSQTYHVFLTPLGEEIVILNVAAKDPTSFTVVGKALDGKPATCSFDYRIVARRLGYENQRLERAPWADDDPNLYPEKRSGWEQHQPPEPVTPVTP